MMLKAIAFALLIALVPSVTFADSPIRVLPPAAPLTGTELFYGVQSGADKRVTTNQFSDFITAKPSALSDVGAGLRTQADRNQDRVSVAEFCNASTLSPIDGTTDNTACIQKAINALCARTKGGGDLDWPIGTYVVSAAVGLNFPCGVWNEGAGLSDYTHSNGAGTLVNVVGAGSAVIFNYNGVVAVGDRYAVGGGLRNMTIYGANGSGAVATQTGSHVHFNNCKGCLIDTVRSWGSYNFATVYGGFKVRVTNSIVDQVVSDGTALLAYGSDAGCADVGNCTGRLDIFEVDHTLIDAASAATGHGQAECIHVKDFVQTVHVVSVVCNQTKTVLRVDCPTDLQMGTCPAFFEMFDLEGEPNATGTGSGAGIIATDFQHMECIFCQMFGYPGVVNLVSLSNSRFTQSGDVKFIGGKFEQADADCIVSSVFETDWEGGLTSGCNRANVSGNGMSMRGNSVVNNSGSQRVMGWTFCNDVNGGHGTTMGGIQFTASSDFNQLGFSNFRGCASTLSDLSGGTHNNLGASNGNGNVGM